MSWTIIRKRFAAYAAARHYGSQVHLVLPAICCAAAQSPGGFRQSGPDPYAHQPRSASYFNCAEAAPDQLRAKDCQLRNTRPFNVLGLPTSHCLADSPNQGCPSACKSPERQKQKGGAGLARATKTTTAGTKETTHRGLKLD